MFAVPFRTPVGTGLPAASLPGGEITAATIDNPTGSWVYLPGLRQYVPPYTLGWAQLLDNPVSSFALEFAPVGPDGTISVARGDALILTLYDFEAMRQRGIVSAGGAAFLPIAHKRIVTGTMPVAASLTNIAFIGADTGRSIRSIQVDNPSQVWLQLAVYGDKIPPSTMGWTKTLPDAPTSITLTALASGPDGSLSVALGDPPSVTLFDDMSAGNSTGSPYVPLAHSRRLTAATTSTQTLNFAFIGADAGRQIVVAVIDNPSGEWLSVFSNQAGLIRGDYVAPFTIGYRLTFGIPVSDMSILPGAGPAGQLATTAGDPYTIAIYDADTDLTNSDFIKDFTPRNTTGDINKVSVTTGFNDVVVIAAVAGKRVRILTMTASISPIVNSEMSSPIFIRLTDPVNLLYRATLLASEPTIDPVWPDGLDWPIGAGVSLGVNALFANQFVDVVITYVIV